MLISLLAQTFGQTEFSKKRKKHNRCNTGNQKLLINLTNKTRKKIRGGGGGG